ncbi:MAG TPA: hypothetical protein VER96_18980 [Polyangiaceae bacterium]|nr:hypothetical protein [Polyangiaceae bacterium]
MISCGAAQRRAWCAALSCGCACAVWNSAAAAQDSALQPQWAAASPSVADRPAKVEPERSSKRTDHVRLGALVSAGFPRPLAVEGMVKIERLVALGVEYSTLPSATVSDVHFGASAIAGSARVFPLRGPFFLGLRAGRQHVSADAAVSGYGYTVPVTLAVDTIFLNPQVGFLWTWDPGITIGIDAGLQIPLKSDVSSTLVNSTMPSAVQQAVSPVQRTMENVAGAVGQTVLPTIDLVKVGMLF